jgi:uroporphyrinogen-III decarboxylase
VTTNSDYLISYIAPAAPATRRPGDGNEPFLRPEIGFTPKWYHQNLDIKFDEKWHSDPVIRRESILRMRKELRHRFPDTRIGRIDQADQPLDLLTGTYGAASIAAIYGVPIIYAADNWPNCAHQYFSENEIMNLHPPDLESNSHFQILMKQVDQISELEGRIEGYINWQGVLNNAQRLRGQDIFMDMMINPDLVKHLFDCVTTTMIDAAKRLHKRQRESGVDIRFFTMSNCLVNMVSAEHYEDFLLPHDLRISESFKTVGVHNCAWNATPYLEAYARIPNIRYIDMGQDSDLKKAKQLFPVGRRAIMYTPMDVANKSLQEIRSDLEKIAAEYGPCDIVAADIEIDTSDQRVLDFIRLCEEISTNWE